MMEESLERVTAIRRRGVEVRATLLLSRYRATRVTSAIYCNYVYRVQVMERRTKINVVNVRRRRLLRCL